MEYQTKRDAVLVTIPALTAAGEQVVEFQPDTSYDEVVGVEAYEVTDGGVANGYYRLGLSDSDKAYWEIQHKNAMLTTPSCPQDKKSRPVNIPIRDGRKIKVRVSWPTGALASALMVEVGFELRRAVTRTI